MLEPNQDALMEIKPLYSAVVGKLRVAVYASASLLGQAAALAARDVIQYTLAQKGEANVILATGNSQLSFLDSLRTLDGVDWPSINVFHMDEYLGLAAGHPASFPLFLRTHLLDYVNPRSFHPVPGDADNAERACREYEALLKQYPADLAVLGIGENGHIAFNDPPHVRFDDPAWVKVVELAEASRRQQVGEGHFTALEDVPTHAITLTIPALLAAKTLLCIVPEARKAEAVRACLQEPISEQRPGSILRRAAHARLFLDSESASKLDFMPLTHQRTGKQA